MALAAGGDYSYSSLDPTLFWFYATLLPGQTAEAVEQALLVANSPVWQARWRWNLNRSLAVLGTSPQCIATNPSDMCVALAALGVRGDS